MALKVGPLTARQFQNYHDNVACVTHGIAVFLCGPSTEFLSPFSKVGTAMIIFHTDVFGSILKLRFTNIKHRPRGVDKEQQSGLFFLNWNLHIW
jgi:hypothetical protein